MKAVVTGGAGFLGSHIVRRLLERGDEVVVVSRSVGATLASPASQADAAGGANPAFTGIAADVRNAAEISAAIKGADVVFHAAAKAGVWGSRDEYFSINLTGTRNVLAACQQHGVRKLVYTSTPSVVFEHGDLVGANEDLPYAKRFLSHYAASKAAAEEEVLAANGINALETVALRPHLIWGNGDPHLTPRVIDRARAGKLKRVGDGTNRVDITHVIDAAEAHLLACDKPEHAGGRAFFISSETVNLWGWINSLLEHADVPPITRSVSRATAYRAGALLEFIYGLFGLGEPPMTRFVAENLATSHWFDITRARDLLGYSPQWTGERAFEQWKRGTPSLEGATHG
jgi:2-alkyl-3-oxoalkanoate reductase